METKVENTIGIGIKIRVEKGMVIGAARMITKRKSHAYVPPGCRDSESRMEALLSKLVKGHKCQENYLREIRADISRSTLKVESHATMIKQLEQ